ncbi:MAG: hypothetical protein ACYC00_22835 [Eubacteriales bacterium]
MKKIGITTTVPIEVILAKGEAIKQYLKNDYEEVICVDEPQFNGAIGCCVYGSKSNIN